jgi:uncharacterized protein (UPF0332 family)
MFNPIEFIVLARELLLPGDEEGRIRTAMGRAYYASFLIARDAVGINEKTSDVHRRVVSVLYRRNPVIANKLHLLRRQRNFADYDTRITLGIDDAKRAIMLAEAVINEVSS